MECWKQVDELRNTNTAFKRSGNMIQYKNEKKEKNNSS